MLKTTVCFWRLRQKKWWFNFQLNKEYFRRPIFLISLSRFFCGVFSLKIIRQRRNLSKKCKKNFWNRLANAGDRFHKTFCSPNERWPEILEQVSIFELAFLHEFRSVRRAQGVVGLAVDWATRIWKSPVKCLSKKRHIWTSLRVYIVDDRIFTIFICTRYLQKCHNVWHFWSTN